MKTRLNAIQTRTSTINPQPSCHLSRTSGASHGPTRPFVLLARFEHHVTAFFILSKLYRVKDMIYAILWIIVECSTPSLHHNSWWTLCATFFDCPTLPSKSIAEFKQIGHQTDRNPRFRIDNRCGTSTWKNPRAENPYISSESGGMFLTPPYHVPRSN